MLPNKPIFQAILSSAFGAGQAADPGKRSGATPAEKNFHTFLRICLTTLSFGRFLRSIE
jgi:hypothetical protein